MHACAICNSIRFSAWQGCHQAQQTMCYGTGRSSTKSYSEKCQCVTKTQSNLYCMFAFLFCSVLFLSHQFIILIFLKRNKFIILNVYFTIFLWQIANIVSSGIQPLHNLSVLVSVLYITSWYIRPNMQKWIDWHALVEFYTEIRFIFALSNYAFCLLQINSISR